MQSMQGMQMYNMGLLTCAGKARAVIVFGGPRQMEGPSTLLLGMVLDLTAFAASYS